MINDADQSNNQQPLRKHKLFLRRYPFAIPPEWDDCDQGSCFDEIDELFEEWTEDDC